MFNLRALFRRDRAEQEMDDELRFHLEKQIEQNVASGMSAEEQSLYEELLRETGAPTETVKEPKKGEAIAGATQSPTGERIVPPIMPTPEREKERRQRGEAEPG